MKGQKSIPWKLILFLQSSIQEYKNEYTQYLLTSIQLLVTLAIGGSIVLGHPVHVIMWIVPSGALHLSSAEEVRVSIHTF